MIYVFSGTGNTLFVAETYRKELKGFSVSIIEIEKDTEPTDEDADLIGFGYPVHAFNPPHIAVSFTRKLSRKKPARMFIFHTGGEGLCFNDSSSIPLRHILSQFTILSERHYVMPYNMIFRHTDEMAGHMLWYMRRLVAIHARSLENEIRERFPLMPVRHFISLAFRIEWPYASFQGALMKADDNCTGCGRCASHCPMKAITMENGRPVFHKGCALCTRCSFHCPENAISLGLLNGWKVNGSYNLPELPENRIPAEKLPRLYRKYYRNADRMLGIG